MPTYKMGSCMWPVIKEDGRQGFCGVECRILDNHGSQRAFCPEHTAEAEAKIAAIKAANKLGKSGPFKSQKMRLREVVLR